MNDIAYNYMDWPRIEAVVYGEENAPRDVMGPRITKDGVLVQGYFPGADSVSVEAEGKSFEMACEDENGYFAAMLPFRKLPSYRYHVIREGKENVFADPYAFPCQITEEEEKAFLAGVYYEAFQKLGAHPMTIAGVEGTYFAVWAPNAVSVSVVGDFVQWDGRLFPMHRMPASGIYELFIPGVGSGEIYKYEIRVRGGALQLKADPYGFLAEGSGGDASVVADLSGFSWTDESWLQERKRFADRLQPLSIFETSLAEWEEKDRLIAFLKETGYTHVELHPVMEYLDEASDGYSTSSYFAPSRRFGAPEDFQQLVNELHKAGIGVILDWAPAQFPKNEAGLISFDGTPLYEIADPSQAVHPMWDTMLFQYGSPMVVDFLISNAVFWTEVYHADGLRLDDVDAMLYLDYGRKPGEYRLNMYGTNENLEAVEFLKHLNSILHKRNPGVLLIAQEDGLWPELTGKVEDDHIGFDFKWSGGWVADLLKYLQIDPIHRKNYHDQLTLSSLYAYSEHYILTLGSRDVGTLAAFRDRLFGTHEQKAAQVRAAYSYLYLHPGCKMTAPDPTAPEEFKALVKRLNEMYRSHPALYAKDDSYDGFEWVQLMNYEENVIAFLRLTEKPEETLLVLCNFAAVDRPSYPVGVPFYGKYKEIFNSDSASFGGADFMNPRAKTAAAKEWDEREWSIRVKLPALGVCVFSCTPEKEPEKKPPVKKAPVKKPAVKKAPEKKPVRKTAAGKKTAGEKPASAELKAPEEKKEEKKAPAKKTPVKKAAEKLTEIKKTAVKKVKTVKTAEK